MQFHLSLVGMLFCRLTSGANADTSVRFFNLKTLKRVSNCEGRY